MQSNQLISQAQNDDGSQSVVDLISAYESGLDELRRAVTGMTPEQARSRPVDGKWSTLEVICHLADSEQYFADRMKRTIAMNHPLLMGVDGFLYPDALHYQDHSLDEELDLITLTRRQTARVLKSLNADAWQRTAVHSETGLVTLRQLLLHAINHVRHHLQFIIEKRALLK